MPVKIAKVSPERRDAVFQLTNEYMRAVLSGDKEAIETAEKRWSLILEKEDKPKQQAF